LKYKILFNISTVHLELLRSILDCRWIAGSYSWRCPAYEVKNPLKNRGHWVGLFHLTLSDISADIKNIELKKAEPFLTLPH
jgi:hypothetical protein